MNVNAVITSPLRHELRFHYSSNSAKAKRCNKELVMETPKASQIF